MCAREHMLWRAFASRIFLPKLHPMAAQLVKCKIWDRKVASSRLLSLCCVFEQDTLSAAWYWFNPGRPILTWLKTCWLGCNKLNHLSQLNFPLLSIEPAYFHFKCCLVVFFIFIQILLHVERSVTRQWRPLSTYPNERMKVHGPCSQVKLLSFSETLKENGTMS